MSLPRRSSILEPEGLSVNLILLILRLLFFEAVFISIVPDLSVFCCLLKFPIVLENYTDDVLAINREVLIEYFVFLDSCFISLSGFYGTLYSIGAR